MTAVGPPYTLFVGIDIAATTVTVAWRTAQGPINRPIPFEQTPQGYAALQRRRLALAPTASAILVVMEATGPYWITLATTLVQQGFVVSVSNPKQARDFAKAVLKRAKTDAIAAQTLSQLAALLQPAPWTPPPAIYTELQQRLAHRDALLDMRQQLRNQRHALLQQPVVVAAVQTRLETLIG